MLLQHSLEFGNESFWVSVHSLQLSYHYIFASTLCVSVTLLVSLALFLFFLVSFPSDSYPFETQLLLIPAKQLPTEVHNLTDHIVSERKEKDLWSVTLRPSTTCTSLSTCVALSGSIASRRALGEERGMKGGKKRGWGLGRSSVVIRCLRRRRKWPPSFGR